MTKELLVYMNDKFVPESEANVSVYDHGLLYGNGVFEGVRAYNNRIFKLDEHVDRMFRSAEKIGLKPPVTKERFRQLLIESCRVNNLRNAYMRPVFTCGVGDLGINPMTCKKPTFFIIARPLDPLYAKKMEHGLRLITAKTVRTPPFCLNPNIKSLNYLNNILAKREALAKNVDEALLLDIEGYVSEATAENVFIIKNGVISTPTTETVLEGITRETAMLIAKEKGYDVRERKFRIDEVLSADEMFLTGTAAEIVPVVELDGRPIGSGKPGKITRELSAAYSELTRTHGTKIFDE